MKKQRQELGRWGETQAQSYLAAQGCRVIKANWRCPAGEVDVIVLDEGCLAFVEVRTRRGTDFGTPEESITPRKMTHMIATAETFVYERGWEGDWRLDVIAIQVKKNDAPTIEWYKNVSG